MNRISSEKEFHNVRFSDCTNRQTPSKYYRALEIWYCDYIDKIVNAEALKILEIGCGIESISMKMESAPFELCAIDISDEAVRFNTQHAKLRNAHFVVQDAHKMLFPNSSFDLVVGRGILHHLDIPIASVEIKRVLNPAGAIIFGEPLDANLLIRLYRRLTPSLRTSDERPLSSRDLNVLRNVFGHLDVIYYGFLTLALAVFGLRSPRAIHWLDDFLLNRLGLGKFLAWACLISSSSSHK